MPSLDVPGAILHYDAHGSGPTLLCIHGDGRSLEAVERRAQRSVYGGFLRSGFSQSYLNGAQVYAHRLSTDADDAAHLIKHISPDAPATVIGNSSGAIVALKVLATHPEVVHILLPYEPPAARFLPDADETQAVGQEVYDIYRASGLAPAFERFMKLVKADEGMKMAMKHVRTDDIARNYNMLYWMEREVLYYPDAAWDVDAELWPHKNKLILVNGELSNSEAYQVRANVALAERLDSKVAMFPGEHVGHASHVKEFAQRLIEVLEARRS